MKSRPSNLSERLHRSNPRVMDEKKSNARPELLETVNNIEVYDVDLPCVTPNWWSAFPMAVFTFLESYDFSGKTIIPFCTHEGSGLGNSERDIKNFVRMRKCYLV